jgi:cell division protein FtsI (penicillin-binding protein 3)
MFLLFLSFFSLIGGALWLQAISSKRLQDRGKAYSVKELKPMAMRGKIMDRDGALLASDIPASAISADPDEARSAPKEKRMALARLLDISLQRLDARLKSNAQFVYLKRQVDQDVANAILKLGINGIRASKEYKRSYPEGEIFSHLIGFANVDNAGKAGIELAAQNILAGTAGHRRVIRDVRGRIVEDTQAVRDPVDGGDIVLSVNSRLQYIAFRELKDAVTRQRANSGSAVVLDVRSGEVLAMTNYPGYDPNVVTQREGEHVRNRALTDAYEPGSTLKPFTVALAMDKRKVTPKTTIQTAPGKLQIGKATIEDAHPHGALSVSQIIEKSSNVGTVKLAMMMKAHDMWNLFEALGFGTQASMEFPGATRGKLRPYKSWQPIEQATMSYGHGIDVSLTQLARAYMPFARRGDIVPLSLYRLDVPPAGRQVISEKTALEMRHILEKATGPDGTAPKAQVRGYRVAGKTGTSYKRIDGRYFREVNGRKLRKYVASFVGFAPASQPRVIVAVMIDEPSNGRHYGGDIAAPVFSRIVRDAMGLLEIAPDSPVTDVVIPQDATKESI